MGARRMVQGIVVAAVLLGSPLAVAGATPGRGEGPSERGPAAHWTADRRDAAQPRDLVIDRRGLGYQRRNDASLVPHGHAVAAAQQPNARPGAGGGTGDQTGPSIALASPAEGATVGAAETFSAVVTDPSGVKSVTFRIAKDGEATQSLAGTRGTGDTWSVGVSGLTDGGWSWSVQATDNVKRGGNSSTSDTRRFVVATSPGGGGGGGGTGDLVTNAPWTGGGAVQSATGRIYFEMPTNRRLTGWAGYVCSGTVATDDTTGRSVILTAAHCVYDDVYKAFARNVLFIPDQAHTSGAGTDTNCANDPYGCWAPSFGVVDTDWTTRTFPDNVAWDYAYYVVDDVNGNRAADDLDATVADLPIQFATPPALAARTHALGYSYSDDPHFMYCAEGLDAVDAVNWWLASCGLSGGSSGGPWIQPMDTAAGTGPIVSVNSWGYTDRPGMAGPKLDGSSATCLFDLARTKTFSSVANRGVKAC